MQAIDQTIIWRRFGQLFWRVASILELPIDDVPFSGADELWWTRFSEWLARKPIRRLS